MSHPRCDIWVWHLKCHTENADLMSLEEKKTLLSRSSEEKKTMLTSNVLTRHDDKYTINMYSFLDPHIVAEQITNFLWRYVKWQVKKKNSI